MSYKKTDTSFKQALPEGELLETYVKAVIGKSWSDHLGKDHPSGYDFFSEKDNCYIDIKASKHSEHNDTCFVEYIQNKGYNASKKANHYSGQLEDGIDYVLIYVDTTAKAFGSMTIFNVRKLRQYYSDESRLVKGGKDARGFRVPSGDTRVASKQKLPEIS